MLRACVCVIILYRPRTSVQDASSVKGPFKLVILPPPYMSPITACVQDCRPKPLCRVYIQHTQHQKITNRWEILQNVLVRKIFVQARDVSADSYNSPLSCTITASWWRSRTEWKQQQEQAQTNFLVDKEVRKVLHSCDLQWYKFLGGAPSRTKRRALRLPVVGRIMSVILKCPSKSRNNHNRGGLDREVGEEAILDPK